MFRAFPHRRLAPLATFVALALVLAMAQRLVLVSLARGVELLATPQELARALVLGTRLDLAVAAAVVLPLVLWATLLPERLWRWTVHRALLAALLTLGLAVWAAALSLEGWIFARTLARPGHAAPAAVTRELASLLHDAPMVALIAAAGALALSLGAFLLLEPFVKRGWEKPVGAGPRARDLLLVAALAVLVVASMPRRVALAGLPVLTQAAGSSAEPVLHDAAYRALQKIRAVLPQLPP